MEMLVFAPEKILMFQQKSLTDVDTTQYLDVDKFLMFTSSTAIDASCGDGMVASWSADIGGKYASRTFYFQNCAHIGGFSGEEQDDETMEYTVETEGLIASYNVISNIRNIIG